jgi:hypothetical protein
MTPPTKPAISDNRAAKTATRTFLSRRRTRLDVGDERCSGGGGGNGKLMPSFYSAASVDRHRSSVILD